MYGGDDMAYTDDWESLMNGVFGPGGKFKTAPTAPAPKPKQPGGLNDLNAALLEQQKKLDAMLKAQSAQIKTQDTATEAALADSRQMLRRPGMSSSCGAAPAPGGTSPLKKRPAAWPPAGC